MQEACTLAAVEKEAKMTNPSFHITAIPMSEGGPYYESAVAQRNPCANM